MRSTRARPSARRRRSPRQAALHLPRPPSDRARTQALGTVGPQSKVQSRTHLCARARLGPDPVLRPIRSRRWTPIFPPRNRARPLSLARRNRSLPSPARPLVTAMGNRQVSMVPPRAAARGAAPARSTATPSACARPTALGGALPWCRQNRGRHRRRRLKALEDCQRPPPCRGAKRLDDPDRRDPRHEQGDRAPRPRQIGKPHDAERPRMPSPKKSRRGRKPSIGRVSLVSRPRARNAPAKPSNVRDFPVSRQKIDATAGGSPIRRAVSLWTY